MPAPKPVTAELGKFGDVMLPAPETRFHNPVPTPGALPLKVALVEQIVCEVPALAVLGKLLTYK